MCMFRDSLLPAMNTSFQGSNCQGKLTFASLSILVSSVACSLVGICPFPMLAKSNPEFQCDVR